MSKWQDISTAPRDWQIKVLLSHQDYQNSVTCSVGWWSDNFEEWQTYDIGGRTDIQPTHWMPLPQPPEGSGT